MQNPDKDVHTKLVSECSLAAILVGTKKAPLLCNPLLLDTEVGSVNCHEAIVSVIMFKMAFEHDLYF